jgi:hypothetical protein
VDDTRRRRKSVRPARAHFVATTTSTCATSARSPSAKSASCCADNVSRPISFVDMFASFPKRYFPQRPRAEEEGVEEEEDANGPKRARTDDERRTRSGGGGSPSASSATGHRQRAEDTSGEMSESSWPMPGVGHMLLIFVLPNFSCPTFDG